MRHRNSPSRSRPAGPLRFLVGVALLAIGFAASYFLVEYLVERKTSGAQPTQPAGGPPATGGATAPVPNPSAPISPAAAADGTVGASFPLRVDRDGADWLVVGEFLNRGAVPLEGRVAISLLVDDQPTMRRLLTLAPIPPGKTSTFEVRFRPQDDLTGREVSARAVWLGG